MSEMVFIKCDGPGCGKIVHPLLLETEKWGNDEFGADFCPNCLESMENTLQAEDDVTTEELVSLANGIKEEVKKSKKAKKA